MNITQVAWHQIPGNKFNRAIHIAMLSPKGYSKIINLSQVGTNKKKTINVFYDKEYVIAWLTSKVIRPLINLSVEDIVDLVVEAHEKELESYKLTQLPIK